MTTINDTNIHPIVRSFVRTQTDVDIDGFSEVGGMGAVYFGKRTILKDRVAMKFYSIDPAGKSHNEPILLKETPNNNILPIYDARILNNQFAYYLTPQISGGDLQDFYENNIIDTFTVFDIISGMLNGLAALHNKDLVHRDLKTFNILIDKASKVAFISDFGFVKKIPAGAASTSASSFTPLYRSPEMFLHNQHSCQSDIYQCGIILFQILGGYFPFDILMWMNNKEKGNFQLLTSLKDQQDFLREVLENRIRGGNVLRYETLPPYVSNSLKTVIRKATHIDLNKRFSTCTEFLSEIFKIRQGSKNWWIDGTHLFCENKKKLKLYTVEDYQTAPVCKISIKGGLFRKRDFGVRLSEIIGAIESD